MPITLPTISRRRFLAGSLAAGVSLLARDYCLAGAAGADADPSRYALLSDIHIPTDPELKSRGISMAAHLRQAIGEVLQLNKLPGTAIINGDCAYLKGLPGDYATLVELLKPLREAGVPLHLAMGNHDVRENFWHALPADDDRARALSDRQVLVIETPHADWFMLDSLETTNKTPGLLGASQLKWLAAALDERANKPAIVMVHHDPVLTVPTTGPTTALANVAAKLTGLLDTKALLALLAPRKQVKAVFYGHTHVWSVKKYQDIHMINLPAVAYVFSPAQPSAWVDAHLADGGISLELRCLDKAHPWHGEKHQLEWRT